MFRLTRPSRQLGLPGKDISNKTIYRKKGKRSPVDYIVTRTTSSREIILRPELLGGPKSCVWLRLSF